MRRRGCPGPGLRRLADLARFALMAWPVGDSYRTLIRLARGQDLARARVDELLPPTRDMATRVLAHGRRQGIFQNTVPPDPLTRAIEAQFLTLLDCADCGLWSDDGTGAATAATKVDHVWKSGSPPSPV